MLCSEAIAVLEIPLSSFSRISIFLKPCTIYPSLQGQLFLQYCTLEHPTRSVSLSGSLLCRDLHGIRCIEKAGKHLGSSLVPRPSRSVLIACSRCHVLCLYVQPSLALGHLKSRMERLVHTVCACAAHITYVRKCTRPSLHYPYIFLHYSCKLM